MVAHALLPCWSRIPPWTETAAVAVCLVTVLSAAERRPAAQVCILDGNKYNARCREVGEQRLEILEECEVLHNQKRDPLLHSSACKNDYHHPQACASPPLPFFCSRLCCLCSLELSRDRSQTGAQTAPGVSRATWVVATAMLWLGYSAWMGY